MPRFTSCFVWGASKARTYNALPSGAHGNSSGHEPSSMSLPNIISATDQENCRNYMLSDSATTFPHFLQKHLTIVQFEYQIDTYCAYFAWCENLELLRSFIEVISERDGIVQGEDCARTSPTSQADRFRCTKDTTGGRNMNALHDFSVDFHYLNFVFYVINKTKSIPILTKSQMSWWKHIIFH